MSEKVALLCSAACIWIIIFQYKYKLQKTDRNAKFLFEFESE